LNNDYDGSAGALTVRNPENIRLRTVAGHIIGMFNRSYALTNGSDLRSTPND
jgi:hypothetical protein